MNRGVAVFLLAAGASAYLKTSAEDLMQNAGYSFEDYVQEYGKVYDEAEYAGRKAAFEDTLAYIRRHNSKKDRTWTAGLNAFTDWSLEELKARQCGLDKKAFFKNHDKREKGQALRAVDLPEIKDWRNAAPPVLSPVKNQGSCGSCWAFGSTETMESAAAIATGKLFELAPQQLVDCAPNPNNCGGTGGCGGSTQQLAFNYTIHAGGLMNESDYKYVGRDEVCKTNKSFAPAVGIRGFVDLKTNDGLALATAVADYGPLTISIAASSRAFSTYEKGVLSSATECGSDIDHAVQLAGYGFSDAVGAPYWIVRNSWGPSWGLEGYIYVGRSLDNDPPCSIDTQPQDGFGCTGGPPNITVCGVCGLLSSSAYATGAYVINGQL